jgi:ribosome-binding protein aMBF1 (putative translation factor)
MITNERQYRITKSRLKRFEDDLAVQAGERSDDTLDPRLRAAMREALASEANALRAQLGRYEQLRDGQITGRELDSLRDLPTALIEARIVAKLTQRALADRLSVAEQQVQRWEATNYAGISLDRLQDIADALGIRLHETVTYASAA